VNRVRIPTLATSSATNCT